MFDLNSAANNLHIGIFLHPSESSSGCLPVTLQQMVFMKSSSSNWGRHLGCGVRWAQRAGLLLGGKKHVLLSPQVTGKPPLLLRSVQVEVNIVLIPGNRKRKCIWLLCMQTLLRWLPNLFSCSCFHKVGFFIVHSLQTHHGSVCN